MNLFRRFAAVTITSIARKGCLSASNGNYVLVVLCIFLMPLPAAADIINFQIDGGTLCYAADEGGPDVIGTSGCANFAEATGATPQPDLLPATRVDPPFQLQLELDTLSAPNSTLNGRVSMGDLQFDIEAELVNDWIQFGCDGTTAILIRPTSGTLNGLTHLCSEVLSVQTWHQVAMLTDEQLALFHAGFAEYDKFLSNKDPTSLWGAVWQANFIRKVYEPGTLALLGIGLFGMGLARRRKQPS